MNKLSKLALFILLIIVFFLLLNILSLNRNGKNPDVEIYSATNGQPMFATGNCNTDLDCSPSGCSDHICANHEVVTTCEEIDFPDKENYECGCVENKCVWSR